jgi:predicted RND superfamily exporter protein
MTAMRITDYLVAWRWSLLAIACGLLAAAWGPAQGLQMDRRIEQMFPVGDPSVEAFEILRKRFGGNAVAMLVYRDESLLSPEGLQRAAEIAAKASRIPGVLGVLSLAEVASAAPRPFWAMNRWHVDFENCSRVIPTTHRALTQPSSSCWTLRAPTCMTA